MVVLVVLMLISALFFPQLKGLFIVLPIVYFIVEQKIRGRSGERNGFDFANLLRGIKQNWKWVVLVRHLLNFFPEKCLPMFWKGHL